MGVETRQPERLDAMRQKYPDKFVSEARIFSKIHRGAKIFVGTACGEPQYLIRALTEWVKDNPKAVFDAEVFQVWTMGVAPYTAPVFKANFRHNSFFIGSPSRGAVNEGLADYTPVFLSEVPRLFKRGLVEVNVALIQVSPPDAQGYMSLGISLDIVKAAARAADIVIAQINRYMPRVHGSGFIHISDIDYGVPYDEALLTYTPAGDTETMHEIGHYVARLINDGDTIQVGYGATPNAILEALRDRKHLGVHTELISDGLVKLMKAGVIDNSQKTLNPGKTVASFAMGSPITYDYMHDHPMVMFRGIDYTNNPSIIAQHNNMVAINAALSIDLTGQATAESIGSSFYSGIGGQADFMRGAVLARNGRSILTIPATAKNGEISRIVPQLPEGAGVTLNRGDVHYVVTEFGIAYLHGKNVRDRAMALIAIAHPKFRPWLIREAKANHIIYKDQAFLSGKRGEYPEDLESFRMTRKGHEYFFRPVKISDETLLKDFFYDLSDNSLYRRFISVRKDMPHERLQEFVIIDYTRELVILALDPDKDYDLVAGVGQYCIEELSHTAEVSFVVRDDYHNKGIGTELLSYLTYLAKKQGLLGFTAEVLVENKPMMHLFEKAGFDLSKHMIEGVYELKMMFKDQ
ncbi:MAG: GNAT family N-acetyltransferase [Candidatus Lernaella stagnicola]|nr:GNAT family N-acetyltransferase [Candidatus Lernaella stagnicola]